MGTPFQPLPCAGDGGGSAAFTDVEQTILCDVDAGGERLATVIMVQLYDDAGVPIGVPTPVDPATGLPYVVQGTLVPCEQAGADAELEILCDVQPDNSSVTFVRHYVHSSGTGELLPGETFDTLADGSPYVPTGVVGSCDPHALCTPDANQDLNADCGPGESVTKQVLLDDVQKPLANDIFVDDATADPLCGGTWDRPASALAAPFPVSETFRNATFDQPGPVTQGTAPYPQLTAGAPVNDGAGAGWLRMADINSGTNGIWQIPSPFSTAQGMNAAITFASHDGTTPGGDGLAFVFTDGGIPAQSSPIGGFGNLGLQNWQGGYIAVVLDEYGQTCTCDQTAPPGGPNPGPCGFCTNTISLQLAGTARIGASCACCTIAQAPLTPKAVNLTTRSTPGRLLVSIIAEGGQTFVSASIDWNDGNGPVLYFDRVNVTACAGPPPAQLRMAAYGGSGGSYRAIKEYRDALARPAGVSNWRAFPITTDPIPACVSLVNITASVDVTVADDGTQTTGNNDPEMYLWLVNTATNTVLDRESFSVLPSQLGVVQSMDVSASVAPGDVPNLRVYVGAESRDQAGEYSSLWENLEITATGTGCPATPRRTLEISARCPIPVTIVGGGTGDGGGGGTTVVNTPSTFENAPICATIAGETQPGFRREVRAPDGSNEVTFLGQDGLPITPETWAPGECPGTDTELIDLCDRQPNGVLIPFVRRMVFDADGAVIVADDIDGNGSPYVPTGTVTICSGAGNDVEQALLCDDAGSFIRTVLYASGQGGLPVFSADWALDGLTPYVPVGTVRVCDGCSATVLGQVCVTSTDFPGLALPATAVQACDGTVTYLNAGTGIAWPNTTGVVICPPPNQQWEEILCDAGNANARFRRVYNLTSLGSVVLYDEDLDSGSYAVVGPAVSCSPASTSRDEELIILCDATPTRFLRRYNYDAVTGALVSTVNTTLDGVTPFAPVGAVGVCTTAIASDFDFVVTTLCDANGTAFLQRLTFNSSTGAVTSTTNTTLTGAAFAPVAPVGVCSNCCPIVLEDDLCTNVGSGRGVAIRNVNGTISLLDAVTGAAIVAANIVACVTDPVETLQARIFNATPGTPWTPALATGTITALSATGISGTYSVTPPEGAAVTALPAGFTSEWGAEDANTLQPPTSIAADAASRVVVVWTER